MSLVNTMMQPLRTLYAPDTLDKNEYRESRYGAWDLMNQQAQSPMGVFSPETKAKAAVSMGNIVTVPVIQYEGVTIGSTRSCTITPDENTSQLITLSWVPYSFGFAMYPSQHYNNTITYEQDFQKKMLKYLLKFAAVLDSASYSFLNTNRNAYFPADITAYYPNTGNALQVTQAQSTDVFNQMAAVLETMDYYEKMHILGSTSLQPLVARLKNQGSQNATNDSFQMSPWTWHNSNRITNGSGVKSTMFAIPEGNIGAINRNDPDSIARAKIGNGLKEWDLVNLPIVNLEVGSFYYEDCVDASSLNSSTTYLTQTKGEFFSFYTEICYLTAYNSNPSGLYSPILKTEISTS